MLAAFLRLTCTGSSPAIRRARIAQSYDIGMPSNRIANCQLPYMQTLGILRHMLEGTHAQVKTSAAMDDPVLFSSFHHTFEAACVHTVCLPCFDCPQDGCTPPNCMALRNTIRRCQPKWEQACTVLPGGDRGTWLRACLPPTTHAIAVKKKQPGA